MLACKGVFGKATELTFLDFSDKFGNISANFSISHGVFKVLNV